MSRPIIRTFGALAIAALLATSSTAAFAADSTASPGFNLTSEPRTAPSGPSDSEPNLLCEGATRDGCVKSEPAQIPAAFFAGQPNP